MQIKPQRYNTSHFSQAKTKNANNAKFWQNCREIGSLIYCWWVNGPVILENIPRVLHKLKYSLTLQLSKAHSWVFMLEEWKTFTQKSVPEYSWQLYLWSPKTGNQPSIFHWVNATVIHLLYNDILLTDFSQLSIELCLNKPFSVENIIGGKYIWYT